MLRFLRYTSICQYIYSFCVLESTSVAFCHVKFHNKYTHPLCQLLWILWLISVFKQCFEFWLVSLKQQDRIFFWNKNISQQTCKGLYIYDVHMEERSAGGGGLKMCHICSYFLFLNICYSILQVRGLWVTQLVIFCERHRCLTPKWFKITTNSVIRGSSFLFNIKPDTFWLP